MNHFAIGKWPGAFAGRQRGRLWVLGLGELGGGRQRGDPEAEGAGLVG